MIYDDKYQNAVVHQEVLAKIVCATHYFNTYGDMSALCEAIKDITDHADDDGCVRLADLRGGMYIDHIFDEPKEYLEKYDAIPDYDGSGVTLYVLDADEWELEQKLKNRKNPWVI